MSSPSSSRGLPPEEREESLSDHRALLGVAPLLQWSWHALLPTGAATVELPPPPRGAAPPPDALMTSKQDYDEASKAPPRAPLRKVVGVAFVALGLILYPVWMRVDQQGLVTEPSHSPLSPANRRKSQTSECSHQRGV